MPGSGVLLAVLLLAEPVASEDLRALAAASPRPALCQPADAGGIPRWQQTRHPSILGYCGILAGGYSVLRHDPERALELAGHAARELQGQAAPSLLRGETLAVLGRYQEATKEFAKARTLADFELRAPLGMLARARAESASGQFEAARAIYRDLVPRAGLIADPRWREGVYVEAAFAVMGEGEGALDEAWAYLTEAQRLSDSLGYAVLINAGLVLVLQRQGRSEQALLAHGALAAMLATDDDPALIEPLVLDLAERHAALAVVAEAAEAEAAAEHWLRYLKVARARSAPWVAHAEQRLGRTGGR